MADKTPKGEATRGRIMQAALACFRRRGIAKTSMRDIAKAAEMSLGAAYHYFPSKDSIVSAYYAWTQDEHERRLQAALGEAVGVRDQMHVLLTTKLDLLRRDRKLLAALFAPLGDPSDPLSLFGPETADVRDRSVASFRSVFTKTMLAEHEKDLAGYAAWLCHLGVLLFFTHDRSKGQERTRKLAAAVADLFGAVVPLAATPLARPLVDRAVALARDLGVQGGQS